MPSPDAVDKSEPPLIPLRFKSLDQLYYSYMPWFKNGGLFIPTSKRFPMGQEIKMLIRLPESKENFSATGVVAWVSPLNSTGHKKQGVGVEFTDDGGMALRYRLDGLLEEKIKEGAPTYTL